LTPLSIGATTLLRQVSFHEDKGNPLYGHTIPYSLQFLD